MTTCLVGLGSNLGDRQHTLDRAVELLRADPELHVVAVSPWHATRPVGGPPDQAEYLNGAIVLETALPPEELLWGKLQQAEHALGREDRERWFPRAIDLDLLLYGDVVRDEPGLVLPHPRMAFRRFVIEPAAEIAPHLVHPTIGWTIEQLRDHLRTALPYVAIAGPRPSPKLWVAEQVVAQCSGRLLREPFSLGREQPATGPAERIQIPFITQASWLLNSEFWEEHDMLRVSDFWFDECLIHASAALPAAQFQQFEAMWLEANERVTRPKLLVVLDAEAEDMLGGGATLDLAEEQPWRRAARLEQAEEFRQAIVDRANRPGQGPVLRVMAADLSLAVAETVAAIQAMQST